MSIVKAYKNKNNMTEEEKLIEKEYQIYCSYHYEGYSDKQLDKMYQKMYLGKKL